MKKSLKMSLATVLLISSASVYASENKHHKKENSIQEMATKVKKQENKEAPKKANSIKEMFTNAKISGDVVLYGEKQFNSGSNKDAGFTMNSIGLNLETAEFNGFKANVGFRSNHKISEVEDHDYDGGADQPAALLHTANISYENDYIAVTLGRQEIDLEWMGDFHEAYFGVLKAIPDTEITVGHSDRMAVADADAVLEKYDNFDGKKNGVNVVDVKYEGIKGLVVNPYYYSIQDLADWYGAKVEYDTDNYGATLHYAASSEDVTAADDGSIMAAELRASISDFSANLGYITTDKDAGIGSMETVGENVNPLEDGNQVYSADADTVYLGVEYEKDALVLGAIYGSTKYSANSDREGELNIGVEYGVTDELTLGALFINVDAENSDDDYNRVTLTAAYEF